MAKLTKEEIIASLKEMTVLELNDLVKAVEEEFGVTAAAPVAVGPAPVEEETAKGPTEVNLVLKGFDAAKKVKVIQAVRTITGLALGDSKALVDKVPSVIKEKISPVEAEEYKKALVEAGGDVEIK